MLEASVETYKRKLENLGDLKRQMKLLEENNMTYMHNTVSLEEELRKANAARAQLETYKRQVSDMQSRSRSWGNLAIYWTDLISFILNTDCIDYNYCL